MSLRTVISRALQNTPLAQLHVRVRHGPAKGAKWTLLPFSYNWRAGGERDVQRGLSCLGDLAEKVCWDFGAHFGIHTVGMAMLVGPTGQVASFEPDPVAFRKLSYHVRINGLANVQLFQAAASEETGHKQLIIHQHAGSSCSHFRYEDELVPEATVSIDVEVIAPDELVAEGRIRLPDLIKVDVQGHGASALKGSINSIRDSRPLILFSNHSSWELAGTRELLSPLGYRAYSPDNGSVDWQLSNYDTAVLRCG